MSDPIKTSQSPNQIPNQIRECYNTSTSNIIRSFNCTCATGTCMTNSSSCPCQQTPIANCICVYLSLIPCTLPD